MRAAHTAAPWVYDDESGQVIAPKCGYQQHGCAVIATVEPFPNFGEQADNGRLIAAAPEMLEALRAVIRVADRKTYEFDLAHAAIAKAVQS